MKITIDHIKKLRQQTGAPVMECKKALEESAGDSKKAKGFLKKWGVLQARKKKGRQTAEGRVFSYIHHSGKIGAMVEILCETDFVARNSQFQNLGHELAMQIASMDPKKTEKLLEQDYIREPEIKIKDLLAQTVAKLGENIVIKKFARFEVGKEGQSQ